MKLCEAHEEAEWLRQYLSASCTRIEIAGSIRRHKAEPNDIELVAIPDPRWPVPLFGEPELRSRLDYQLLDLTKTQYLEPIKGGDKFKQFWVLKDGRRLIKLDLFIVTPPAQWGVLFLIRTGPAEFSQQMVTQRSRGGRLPNGYRVEAGRVVHEVPFETYDVATPEEMDYFRLCEMEYIEPQDRHADWGHPWRVPVPDGKP